MWRSRLGKKEKNTINNRNLKTVFSKSQVIHIKLITNDFNDK